jgi:hypothetical protein
MAKDGAAVGLNLDIEPRHWTSGAKATQQQRAREKRLKIAKGDVIIRAEHRLKGAEAANRAKKRALDEDGIPIPDEPRRPVLAPFARSHGALADLCHVFGYPPAVVPTIGKYWEPRVHRIKVAEDNHSADPRPQNMPRHARPKHSDIYRVRHGIQERLCRSCGQWLPLTLDNYRWRNDRATGSWNGECRPCDNLRRRETIARRKAGG